MFNPGISPALVILLQTAAVYGVACGIARLLAPIPALRLAFWQSVLRLVLFMPLVESLVNVSSPVPLGQFRFTAATLAVVSRATLSYAQLIAPIVFAGIALKLLYLAAGVCRLSVLRRRSEAVADALIPELSILTGIHPQLLLSRQIAAPASYGWKQPVILVPATWPTLHDATRRAALVHEFVHLQRRDWLPHFGEELLLAAVWFHPIIYGLVRRIRLAREQVVDQRSIAITGQRRDYLSALLAFSINPPARVPVPCFSAASQLKQRVAVIQAVIQKEPQMLNKLSRKKAVPPFLCACTLLAASAIAVVWTVPLHSASVANSASGSNKIYKVGNGVTAPEVISKVNPKYTPEARKAHIEGVVILNVVVGKDGVPRSVRVVRALDSGLNREAIQAVQQWRFKPATRNGQPVNVSATTEITFRLLP